LHASGRSRTVTGCCRRCEAGVRGDLDLLAETLLGTLDPPSSTTCSPAGATAPINSKPSGATSWRATPPSAVREGSSTGRGVSMRPGVS
jgi:hypothetical protein